MAAAQTTVFPERIGPVLSSLGHAVLTNRLALQQFADLAALDHGFSQENSGRTLVCIKVLPDIGKKYDIERLFTSTKGLIALSFQLHQASV